MIFVLQVVLPTHNLIDMEVTFTPTLNLIDYFQFFGFLLCRTYKQIMRISYLGNIVIKIVKVSIGKKHVLQHNRSQQSCCCFFFFF